MAGNRKHGIGVVEVMGLVMIPAGLVSLVAGGGRMGWRVGVPGVAFGVIFLAIGAASARRAASAAKVLGPNHRHTRAVTLNSFAESQGAPCQWDCDRA